MLQLLKCFIRKLRLQKLCKFFKTLQICRDNVSEIKMGMNNLAYIDGMINSPSTLSRFTHRTYFDYVTKENLVSFYPTK